MRANAKKVLIALAGVLALAAGVVLIASPFLENAALGRQQEKLITRQEETVQSAAEDQTQVWWEQAQEYNRNLAQNAAQGDPFTSAPEEDNGAYLSVLNINGDGVMASVEIPKIGVNLPVYHGTADATLRKGAGHLQSSSLPVGGKGTHAVISAHSGLRSAALFTDLEQLAVGDVFFIRVLGRELAYEVDQCKTVLPSDTGYIQIDPNEDFVTLMTCVPIGVNSHRLLVRGRRTDERQAREKANQTSIAPSEWMKDYRSFALWVMVAVAVFAAGLIFWLLYRRRKRKKALRAKPKEP